MKVFKGYESRQLELRSIAVLGDWNVKVYTITFQDKFESVSVLNYAIKKLPEWLQKTESSGLENYQIAFLIVHEGRDGIWTLLNWWVGENMLQSMIFYTALNSSGEFKETPQTGGMACVWELEVINFERQMWIEHILKKARKPDFAAYLEQKIEGRF